MIAIEALGGVPGSQLVRGQSGAIEDLVVRTTRESLLQFLPSPGTTAVFRTWVTLARF